MTATEHRKQQLDLPFDQHQRYRIVADALDQLREDSGALEVLDVGGGEGIILNFLPGDRVTVLDQTETEGVPDFVVGDATALPFEDESFDYVTSLDVYEHIGPASRDKYLTELRRVARRGVFLAAPFDSGEVREAERLANDFHRAMHLKGNVWLIEHEQNGLPNLDRTRAYFERRGDEVTVLPNGYLPHWLAMISLFFYEAFLEGESRQMLERLNRFYNEFMYEYDNSEPSYRHLVVALKEAPKRDVDLGRLASPSEHSNPAMSLSLLGTFSAALVPGERLKKLHNHLTQKDLQLVQKEIQIRDLFERLARQTVTANNVPKLQRQVATLNEEKNQLRQQIDELQGQLSASKKRLNQRIKELKRQTVASEEDKKRLTQQLDAVKNSRSWKIIEKQGDLRTALKNTFRGRSNENDG